MSNGFGIVVRTSGGMVFSLVHGRGFQRSKELWAGPLSGNEDYVVFDSTEAAQVRVEQAVKDSEGSGQTYEVVRIEGGVQYFSAPM